ncbi:hypothetical protein ACX818_001409 [Acinetobacter baumannii]
MSKLIKVRKKPIEVYAVQWTGTEESYLRILKMLGFDVVLNEHTRSHFDKMFEKALAEGLKISTLEGTMTASLNDYVIQGAKGEYYPCKPDIFEMSYDVVWSEL